MPSKRNLLFLNYSFDVGGIETLILAICKALRGDEFNLSVCSFKDKNALKEEFAQLGIPLYALRKNEGIDLKLIFRLRKFYKKHDIDIVHTHNAAQCFYGVLASLGLKKPVIIHTQHSELRPEERKLLYFLRRFAYKISCVVCVAKYVADYLIEKGKISEKKIKVIYNGIDINKYKTHGDKKKIKSSLGIPADYKVIGNIARLAPIKDHKTLLAAFNMVLGCFPDIKLMIVGNGALWEELKRYSAELNIEKAVVFTGERRDIPELLNVMDVFVLSSLSEGLSMTLLEAMASGLPVVATAVGGNPEVIVADKTGLLVPPEDPEGLAKAIICLLENQEKALSMARDGEKRTAEKFAIEKMAGQYKELYQTLAAGNPL